MGWLAELLIYAFARPILQFVLGLFGYDLDWEPKDGHKNKGWSQDAPKMPQAILPFDWL
jgi:hypothetical protein